MAEGHYVFKGTPNPHYPDTALDSGGCLTGHESPYKENNSCSYRWQSVARSRTHRKPIYNKTFSKADTDAIAAKRDPGRQVPSGFLRTSAYLTKEKKKVFPGHYSMQLKLPEDWSDWFMGGPNRSGVMTAVGTPIPDGCNFERDTWPYWNNAHHMIPKGTLKEVIEEETEGANPDVRTLIVNSLLEAKYNVNSWKNMILLPQDKEVGMLYGLPRHLVLEDDTIVVDEESPKFNHVQYNVTVTRRLSTIVLNFKQSCDQALAENCDTKLVDLSKKALEDLSKDCFIEITKFTGGEAISAIKQIRVHAAAASAGLAY